MKIIIILFILIISSNSYAKEEQKDEYNKQWNTVLQLQRIIDNDILKEAPNLFSKRVKSKIKSIVEKDPQFFKSVWRLSDFKLKLYKNNVFKGKGIFILEDNEWKIDEL